jgi:hypothetical protein
MRTSRRRFGVAVVSVLSMALAFVSVVLAGPAAAKAVEGNCMATVTPTAVNNGDGTVTVSWTDACSNIVLTGGGVYLGYYNIEVSNDGGQTWTQVNSDPIYTARLLSPPSENGSYTVPSDYAYPCGSLVFRVIAVATPNMKVSISKSSNAIDSPAGECGGGGGTGECEQGSGALTLGFYSNKNGKATETDADFAALTALHLRNGNGSDRDFTGTLSQNKKDLASWLLNATATNMSYMLSAQLATLELNILHGLVDPGAVICDDESQFDGQTVGDLVAAAEAYLAQYPVVKGGDAQRAYGDALETIIDEINNNLVAFV